MANISIHAPLTGSDRRITAREHRAEISIHAPLTGSDLRDRGIKAAVLRISIHAPLTGSDLLLDQRLRLLSNFNPRSPYGERLSTPKDGGETDGFQSTLPLRGATAQPVETLPLETISIHAPLTGSDKYPSSFPAAY